jgi:hypothetical protein
MALAGAAELSCDLRGLQARIVYEPSGRVVVYDGSEVLAEAQGDPLEVSEMKATCLGDRFRLVRGGNVALDGDHATLSVGTMEIDLGPLLDTLPPERFDPRKAGLRKARRAASSGEWQEMDQLLAAHQPLTKAERDQLVEVLLQEGSKGGVARAWSMVAGSESSLRTEAGMTLLRMHVDEGELDEVQRLAEKLPDVDEACEWAGRIDWMQGKKGKARKHWATCGALSEEAEAWCAGCR